MSLKKIKNKILWTQFIFAALLLQSCEIKETPPPLTMQDALKDAVTAQKFIEKSLSKSLTNGFYAPVLENDNFALCFVEEENSFSEWGIKFVLATLKDSTAEVIYTSPVLDGSIKESRVRLIRLPGYSYSLLYYNSGSYFIGSGGGEVYAYLADFQKKIFTSAFLETGLKGKPILTIPDDADPEIRRFLIAEFRKEYPLLSAGND